MWIGCLLAANLAARGITVDLDSAISHFNLLFSHLIYAIAWKSAAGLPVSASFPLPGQCLHHRRHI